jgi:hypothetical protein
MKLKQKWLCVGLLLVVANRSAFANAQDLDDILKVVFRNAVLKIDVSSNTPVIKDGVNVCNAEGTAFLISSSHVATAGHVLQVPAECGKPVITLKSRRHNLIRLAEVIASRDDIALLKTDQVFPSPMCALVPMKSDMYDVKGIRFGIPGQLADPVPNPVQIGEDDSEFRPFVRLTASPAESGESGGPVVYNFNVVGILKAKHKHYVGYSFMMVASMLRALMDEYHVTKDERRCNPVDYNSFASGVRLLQPDRELGLGAREAVYWAIREASEELSFKDRQIEVFANIKDGVVISGKDRIESKSVCIDAPTGGRVCTNVPVVIPGPVVAQTSATIIRDMANEKLWKQVMRRWGPGN